MLNQNIINIINGYLPNYYIIDNNKYNTLLEIDTYINYYLSDHDMQVVYLYELPSQNHNLFIISKNEQLKTIKYEIISKYRFDSRYLLSSLYKYKTTFEIIIYKQKINK